MALISKGPADDSEYLSRTREALGLPEISEQQPLHDRKLAICGGGPSLASRLGELQGYDVWGINATASWLIERGIDATFVTVDPMPEVLGMVGKAKRALLDAGCHPDLFGMFEDVRVFYTRHHPLAVWGGSTTATRIPMLAFRLGYQSLHYFGCDGSYGESTHLYRNEPRDDEVIIRAGGREYLTAPDFILQSTELCDLMRLHPTVFHCHSDGLLPAMLENWDTWEWVAVSEKYRNYLRDVNGDESLFAAPYRGNHAYPDAAR